jgi:hypothetical protein
MPLAAYTKLEAVNSMLLDMGERPVSQIVAPDRLDVTIAVTTLDETLRQEQLRGWWFNTELLEITPDGSGIYQIPTGIVRVDERRAIDGGVYPELSNPTSPGTNFVVRDGVLYDTISRTSSGFTKTLKLVGVYLLEFDELPETVKRAVTGLASIDYQLRSVGSLEADKALRGKAAFLRMEITREDAEHQDYNLQASPRFRTLMLNR